MTIARSTTGAEAAKAFLQEWLRDIQFEKYLYDSEDSEKIAAHAQSTFWMVLPSLPMFLVLPALLRHGMHFYPALALSCALTVVLYVLMVWTMKRFGIDF